MPGKVDKLVGSRFTSGIKTGSSNVRKISKNTLFQPLFLLIIDLFSIDAAKYHMTFNCIKIALIIFLSSADIDRRMSRFLSRGDSLKRTRNIKEKRRRARVLQLALQILFHDRRPPFSPTTFPRTKS